MVFDKNKHLDRNLQGLLFYNLRKSFVHDHNKIYLDNLDYLHKRIYIHNQYIHRHNNLLYFRINLYLVFFRHHIFHNNYNFQNNFHPYMHMFSPMDFLIYDDNIHLYQLYLRISFFS